MSDVAHPRSPFAGVPTRDIVRDVVAAVALLVALPLPWDATLRGSDLLWVVLTTVVALLTVAAPYAQRAGLVPEGWARVATPRARLVGLAPYALVALLYVVLDLLAVGDGGIGAGLALGMSGAVLAAALPTTRGMVASSVLVAVVAVATPLTTAVAGLPWPVVVGAILAALLVIGILWLTAGAFLRRHDDAAGMVLLAVGGAVALELALLGGGAQHGWVESLHADRYGLLLLPVVAAFAVPAVLERASTWVGEPAEVGAARWVRVAVRALDLVIVVAAFVALVAVVRLVAAATADLPGFGFGVEPVLRLIVGVLVIVMAFLARRALVRDARTAHATAVGAACVIVVLGLVILVARAGVGTRSHVEELLLALALPGVVLVALLVPPSVRELVGSGSPSATTPAGGTPTGGWLAADPSTSPVSVGQVAAPTQRPAGAQEPAYQQETYEQETYQRPSSAQPVDDRAAVEETAVQQPVVAPAAEAGSRWRGTWAAGTDATQQMAPVEAAPAAADDRPAQRPDQTQVLQPVGDGPGSRWTPEQALDPTTPLADLAQIVQEAPHLRPHVAANPSTYPALLDWLGALGDPAVDAALRTRR
ncbi:hypothetical protein MWU57_10605 [Isoptericola sp. S6320L]|uniref:DUF7937 domain-containing protein n=1 Tax=Isoptericola sp. S6320L TaxID=2926411 RepID=UPI001FF0EF74|nr:hypothetical protein [Isoptericola sp. S6320L]MCK0117482.1 hypothetical protein [Isoptericola sp. S6320L]